MILDSAMTVTAGVEGGLVTLQLGTLRLDLTPKLAGMMAEALEWASVEAPRPGNRQEWTVQGEVPTKPAWVPPARCTSQLDEHHRCRLKAGHSTGVMHRWWANGDQPARYWTDNGEVTVDNYDSVG